jgi:hypothetical protein
MAMRLTPKPIMSPNEERYMALEGLMQWTEAVISQAKRVAVAKAEMASPMTRIIAVRWAPQTWDAVHRRAAVLAFRHGAARLSHYCRASGFNHALPGSGIASVTISSWPTVSLPNSTGAQAPIATTTAIVPKNIVAEPV